MSYAYPEIKTFRGLFAQPNTFTLPDGAMEEARNVVINDDNILQKIRGFYEYYDAGVDIVNATFFYQQKLIGVFSNKIGYFADSGAEPNVTGTLSVRGGHPVAVSSPMISRNIEQNGNLYFTSDSGVLKLDAYNGDVWQAGTPGGLDCRGAFLPKNGPIPGDSQIAYRVCFGREDANGNLLLGAPSDIVPLTNVLLRDQPWSRNGANLVTVVTTVAHNLVSGMQITVTASTGTHPVTLGSYTITVVNATTYTFTNVGSTDSGHVLSYKVSRAALITSSIPDDINLVSQNYFIQIYRTTESNSDTASPSADFKLVEQITLDSVSLSSRVFTYEDNTDSVLLTNATELYTNPNSREGELQANLRPPYCTDMALFQNYVFYADCTTRHILNIDVIDTSGIANNDYLEVKVDATIRRYVARSGVGNQTSQSEAITNASGNLSITYTAHGFSNGDKVFISYVVGGSLAVGEYTVSNAALNTFEIGVAYSAVTYLFFEGVSNGTYPIFQFDKTSGSVGTQLRRTAQGIIKAINRDLPSLVYGNYVSGIDDTPGKIRISAEDFTGTIYLAANGPGPSFGLGLRNAFSQVLPANFTSTGQVSSRNNIQKNAVFISKVGEPEAVPVVNYLLVGSKNKAIKRIFALRDSVILLKEDGIFKITGSSIANFSVTPLDTTVIVLAANSGALLNNKVYFLGTQGICSATDSSVEILSRRIENFIEPILGATNLNEQTAAVSYESDRTYRISTLGYNSPVKNITYIYNSLNDTWTSSDYLFTAGVVGPQNKLFIVSNNSVLKERKYGNRLEFTGQNYACSIDSVFVGNRRAIITIVGRTPQIGDIIVHANIINRIRTVQDLAAGQYLITFAKASNLFTGLSTQLYANIESNVVMAPYHGGTLGLGKQFAQIQFHTRSQNITRLRVTFQGASFGGSEEAIWSDANVLGSVGGWGFAPWGFFPWGQAETLEAKVVTEPAPVVRLYVPLFQQRNTFIQTVLNHTEAGESMDIQSISWSIRQYKERVSK